VHLDFIPQFTPFGEYELYPFAGAVLKKHDGVHLISEEQYTRILAEVKERLEKQFKKVKSRMQVQNLEMGVDAKAKVEVDAEGVLPSPEIFEAVFKEEIIEFADQGVFSKRRARELREKIEEEGRDATIAYINGLGGKDRLYPSNREKQERLRKTLVAGINSFPQKARTLFYEIGER
jgi:hypothetical protein